MATFGKTTVGANTAGPITGDTTIGGRFTATQTGTLNKIWAYVNINAAGTAPMRAAIFSNTGSNTIGTLLGSAAASVNISNTTPQWISVDVTASIVSGNDYWLFVWVDPSGFSSDYNLYYDTSGTSNSEAIAFGIGTFADWTQVGDGTNENYTTNQMSIYGEFTPLDQIIAWIRA